MIATILLLSRWFLESTLFLFTVLFSDSLIVSGNGTVRTVIAPISYTYFTKSLRNTSGKYTFKTPSPEPVFGPQIYPATWNIVRDFNDAGYYRASVLAFQPGKFATLGFVSVGSVPKGKLPGCDVLQHDNKKHGSPVTNPAFLVLGKPMASPSIWFHCEPSLDCR